MSDIVECVRCCIQHNYLMDRADLRKVLAEIERQAKVIEAARADRRWHHIGSCDCNLCNALRALDGGGDE